MSDRIDFGGEPWRAIPRSTMRDATLSPRAKGGLVTLLSHDEGWIRSCIAILMHENNCGRKQAQSIMAELREAGYAELVKEHVDGRVKTRHVVRAVPERAGNTVSLFDNPDLPETCRSPSWPTSVGSAVVEPKALEPLEVEPREANAVPDGVDRENPVENATSEWSMKGFAVPDRWPYFLWKLQNQDTAWNHLTVGALVRIAKGSSAQDVTTALSFAAEHAPVLTGSAYGWLDATAKALHQARVGA